MKFALITLWEETWSDISGILHHNTQTTSNHKSTTWWIAWTQPINTIPNQVLQITSLRCTLQFIVAFTKSSQVFSFNNSNGYYLLIFQSNRYQLLIQLVQIVLTIVHSWTACSLVFGLSQRGTCWSPQWWHILNNITSLNESKVNRESNVNHDSM